LTDKELAHGSSRAHSPPIGLVVPSDPPRPASPRDFLGVGSAIAALVAGGMLLGWFIDTRINTLPIFALVGLAAGITAACFYAYFKFRRFMRN
jgi:putative F0F1-ATPase subunit (Ca2+/Mg2+ transporter)